jgi:electron transport complex protein RnfB
VFDLIWIPVVIIGGLGLIFGLVLSIASKKFEVKVDERIEKVRELLPGANCAACGHTGCDGFAEAVVEGKAGVSGCPASGAETAAKIAEILGVEAEEVERKIARVMCGGTYDTCRTKFDYSGIRDCAAIEPFYGGPSTCSYGCVGMGNCAKACPFGAMVIENGLAKVIASKCTGCGKCVEACPKKIIELVPVCLEYTVRCSSLDRGNIVRKSCDVGCIGCGRCVKACEEGAIKLHGTLAKIDPEICKNCGECEKVCPTKSIQEFKCSSVFGDISQVS